MTKGVNLSTSRNKSKYQSGSIIYLDEPKDYPDRVTLGGVKPSSVLQVSDDGKEINTATVQVSRGLTSRQPYWTDEQKAIKRERKYGTTVIPGIPGYKWCSRCDEWVKVEGFSPDKRNRDGYHTDCKDCRAAHSRLMYWHQKNTAPQRVAA